MVSLFRTPVCTATPRVEEKQLESDDESILKPSHEPRAGVLCSLWAWVSTPLDWWDHRRDGEVEQVRRVFEGHLSRWERAISTWDDAVEFGHRRQIAWAEGTDVEGWECHAYFSFSPKHRYAVQASQEVRDALGAPHELDFRTPEGRAAAVAWFEHGAAWQREALATWAGLFDQWDAVYQDWRRWGRRRRQGGGGCRSRSFCKRARRGLMVYADIPTRKVSIGFRRLPR